MLYKLILPMVQAHCHGYTEGLIKEIMNLLMGMDNSKILDMWQSTNWGYGMLHHHVDTIKERISRMQRLPSGVTSGDALTGSDP